MGEGWTRDQKMPRGKLPHFFEIYSSVSSSKRLKIPDNFSKHMEGKNSGLVSLEGPSGNVWQVELSYETGSLSLHSGWSTFLRDNSIMCGDLLVFRYNGNLHFSVQIFDKSACEKEVAFHAKCSQDPSDYVYGNGKREGKKDEATRCSKNIYDAMPNKINLCHIPDDESYWIEDVVTVAKHQSSNILAEAVIPLRSVSCHEKCDLKNGSFKKEELDLPSSSHILRSSSAEEKKIAHSFTSSYPYFVRIMKKFNVSGSYTLENSDGIKRKKRKSMEVNSKVLGKVKKLNKKSLKTSLEGSPTGMKKHTSASRSSTVGKASTATATSLQTNDCLSTLVSLHEEKVARSFRSNFPSFVRVMKRFNISGSYTLKIPHQFSAAYLPQCKTEIVLWNQKGESWTVNSVPDSKGRLSHTFCGGWLSFVRDNGIQMGDTCIFELVGRFEMRVHISDDGRGAIVGTCS